MVTVPLSSKTVYSTFVHTSSVNSTSLFIPVWRRSSSPTPISPLSSNRPDSPRPRRPLPPPRRRPRRSRLSSRVRYFLFVKQAKFGNILDLSEIFLLHKSQNYSTSINRPFQLVIPGPGRNRAAPADLAALRPRRPPAAVLPRGAPPAARPPSAAL